MRNYALYANADARTPEKRHSYRIRHMGCRGSSPARRRQNWIVTFHRNPL